MLNNIHNGKITMPKLGCSQFKGKNTDGIAFEKGFSGKCTLQNGNYHVKMVSASKRIRIIRYTP
ncbi:hypothetical protein [Croceitalea sp. MTPC5]|uniref:hypothetical protein n=1 Tax=Croceitalea sp. MTPC5 TaxID=3056565 RepID=UPI0030D5A9C1